MIDIENEQIIPLRQAHKYVPGRPHISCIYRWMQRRENPLETIRVGGAKIYVPSSNPSFHSTVQRGRSPNDPGNVSGKAAAD